MSKVFSVVTALLLMIVPSLAFCAEGLNGAELSIVWIIPFVCMLLSIAVMPLVIPHFWHHHFGKISGFWALAFLVPCAVVYGPSLAAYLTVHALLLEYLPFIILLFALFTVAGGIRLTGSLAGSPVVNLGILATGTVLASFMGTTGAAMLLIRPLLRANAHRKYRVHQVVFFIFLVANIGGSLSPLGDPPLFLGYLKGVEFFWTTTHLFAKTCLAAGILLALFFVIDTVLFAKEGKPVSDEHKNSTEKLGLDGKINLPLLLCVVIAVLVSGLVNFGEINIFGTHVAIQNLARDLILIGIALLSLKLTSKSCRELNNFTWEPILEVGKLFIGIFLSMIPAITILQAGENGALSSIVRLVSDNGQPNNAMYFWMTGILSSFLDNAPTYLVFFNTAGGAEANIAQYLMYTIPGTLTAISAGAVFMGAMTYIGNAPNFMVRSIAESQNVKMPSFFGYMVWSVGILCPVFALLTFIFFV